MVVETIRPASDKGSYRVTYRDAFGGRDERTFYAKDEMDAYMQATAMVTKEKKDMRTLVMGLTLGFVVLVTSITYSCNTNRNRVSNDMMECTKLGKSFVSEAEGYSCRDPFVKVQVNK